MQPVVTVQFIGAEMPADMTIEHAARNARMYRIAARDLRKCGRPDAARKCERNARACERAIVRAADAMILETATIRAIVAGERLLRSLESTNR